MKRSTAALPFLLPLLLALLPGAAAAESEREEKIAREVYNLFQGCRNLAISHLGVLDRLAAPAGKGEPGDREKEAVYADVIDRAEQVFLAANATTIRNIDTRVLQLENEILGLPPEKLTQIPMANVTALCRMAGEPHGAGGKDSLREGIAIHSRAFGDIQDSLWNRGYEASPRPDRLRSFDEEQEDYRRLHPNDKPISPAEYKERKAKWEAHQREEEIRQGRELRARQEALEAQRAANPPPVEEARVTVRKDLPATPPRFSEEQRALYPQVAAWHKTYSHQVAPFKMVLSELLATPATNVYARREACKKLYTAVGDLAKSDVLKAAPDPAIAAPAVGMAAKFQSATDACLVGKRADMDRLMKEAEAELGKLAAALTPYGLAP